MQRIKSNETVENFDILLYGHKTLAISGKEERTLCMRIAFQNAQEIFKIIYSQTALLKNQKSFKYALL